MKSAKQCTTFLDLESDSQSKFCLSLLPSFDSASAALALVSYCGVLGSSTELLAWPLEP
jgi:hypothetical protein